MNRKNPKTQPLRLSTTAEEMITTLAQQTSWSRNIATSHLVALGCYYFTCCPVPLQQTADIIEMAIRTHAIRADAEARIAALKNRNNIPPTARPQPKKRP